MAFSTQKDFFHVPFMNESVEYECKRACVKLKSYDSTIDDRSWAHDDVKQSKFLSDLVTCQFAGGKGGYGDSFDDGRAGGASAGGSAGGGASGGGASGGGASGGGASRGGAAGSGIGGNGVLSGGDSLLECANIHLAEYQKVMNIKQSLEKQLEISNDRLKTAKDENKKIKEILASKLDSNTAKDFYNKIQKLIAAGKLGKNEENEMLQIYKKMENLYKAYEIIQAENYYLKRLIEKMASRVSLENIKSEPETSTDVSFLQKEVNTLRKECTMLRKMEDDYLRIKQQTIKTVMTEQDAENIKTIIKERNSLREKCKSLSHLERKVHDLESKASEAERIAGQLNSNLNNQSNYINKVEGDLQSMQKYYEDANQNACFTKECLKAQIDDLKEELMSAKCQAQKAEMLSMEVGCLRNEVLKRDLALNDYDCQYKQLMDVVNELQAIKLQCLQDNQTQTCKAETDELAFFASATIEEIMKELKTKGCLNTDFNMECCEEMKRLKKQVEVMQKELDDSINLNAQLLEKIKDGEEKMAEMLEKIEQLEGDIYKNEQEAIEMRKDLADTLALVNEIRDVQFKNQQLANAVSALNSRDDQKIIDDLRRQLEEELAKLKKCQEDNNDLIKEAKERENDLQKLKDLNKKLEADKKKVQAEKQKLKDDIKNKQNIIDRDKAAALDDFINKNSEAMKAKLEKGRCFEKELRNLLDEFIQECRFCFCRLGNPKSKFYGICQKLYHCGMNSLSFLELGYLHRKLFALAEQQKPGCLLNMVLEEYKEHARSLLMRDACEGGGEVKLKKTNMSESDNKCCYCKSALCCNNSEEMIKEKVHKLEKDVKMAQKYLFTLKKIPLDTGLPSECDDTTSDVYNESSTFRSCSPQVAQQKAMGSQLNKKLKARLMKKPEIILI